MSLQDKIEKVTEQVTRQVILSSKQDYEKNLLDMVSQVYRTGDVRKIEAFTKKADKLIEYVETRLGIKKQSHKEMIEGRIDGREKLIKVLEKYEHDQLIPKDELAEKTGLNFKQLYGYTKGKNPIIIKQDDCYKPGRILKKK
ncbi:MAG: hypothetical protein V1645_01655 [archaeon]